MLTSVGPCRRKQMTSQLGTQQLLSNPVCTAVCVASGFLVGDGLQDDLTDLPPF